MKKSYLFMMLTVSLFLFGSLSAQVTHTIDFEPGGVGADWDWTMDQNDDNPPLEFISNPVSGGINTSATVAQFTVRQNGQPWALCFTSDDGEFTFDATNSTVTLMVYKSTISNIGFKFEGMSPAIELQVANTLTDQWEEITFDFSASIGNTYDKIVIIPDFTFDPRPGDNIIYLDNIMTPDGEVAPPPTEPTVAAPDPTIEEENVFSIYSGVYTDLEGTNFNPSWGQSTIVTIDYPVAGNNTLKYENLNYQGTNLGSVDGGVPQDVSGYEYFHLDFWTPNSTTLNFYLLDQTAGEVSYALSINTEEWVSVDIPLSYFSAGGENLTDIHQFKVDGNGTVFFDNWYFYMSPVEPEPEVAAPTPTNEEVDVVSIFSDSYTDLEGTDFNPGWGQTTIVTTEDIDGNFMLKYDVFNYQGTQLAAAQDLSLMEYVHFDLWTNDATIILFSPISVSTGEFPAMVAGFETGEWNSYDLPLSLFAGVSMSDIHQLKFDGQTGVTPSTIYLDNIYFWKEPTPAGSDATLSDLQIDGETVEGFAPTTLYYNVELPIGTSEVPEVTATTNDPEATYVINDATELPGTTDVIVTAENDSTMLTYSVEFTLEAATPAAPAPDPTIPEEDVVSIYSDSYTDLAGTDFFPGWGQSTIVTFETIDDNEMMKYDVFNYQGTQLAAAQDLSSMGYVHLDIWTPDATVIQFTPISVSTGEFLYSLTPLETETWNSYDIPLSAFEGVSMADIHQLKFDGQSGVSPSTVYLDNIYFYSVMTTDPPENVYVDPMTWLCTWSPPGGSIIHEDFEAYNVGEYLAVQSEHWTTWSDLPGTGEDAFVSDEQALSGTNSLKLDAAISTSDMVLIMEDYTTGAYVIELHMYVPTGGHGYYNIQKSSTPGEEWGFQVDFPSSGTAVVDADGFASASFAFNFDEWMDLQVMIDIDADWAEFYYDGTLIREYQWSLGTDGVEGLHTVGGVNIYANGADALFFVDDVDVRPYVPTRELTGYNVYLDGTQMASDLTVYQYQFTDLVAGQEYTAGVEAVYDDGVSDMTEYVFTALSSPITPPTNLMGEVQDYNDVMLTWEAPAGAGEWVRYDDGTNFNAIGLGGGTPPYVFSAASKWEPADLAAYDGATISKIQFFPNEDADFTLKIWTGPNAEEVYSQVVTEYTVEEFTDIILDVPYTIDASTELWFGYEVSHDEGFHPAGTDPGPAVAGYGDLVSQDGGATWDPLSGFGLDYNWNLAIYVEGSGGAVALSKSNSISTPKTLVNNTRSSNLKFSVTATSGLSAFETTEDEDRILTGYNIYADGEMAGSVADDELEYLVEGLDSGEHEFYVTAVYDNGESDPSNMVTLTIVLPVPMNFNAISQGAVGNILCTWNAPAADRGLTGYKIYRDDVEVGTATGLFFIDSGVPTGNYVYHATAVYSDMYESEASNQVEVDHVGSTDNMIPLVTELTGNYPNPFNPTTQIKFAISEASEVNLEIYNIRGEKVRTLVNGYRDAAFYTEDWDGTDDDLRNVSSGVYFYKMKAGRYTSTKKMILMK